MQAIFDRIHAQFARLKQKYHSEADLSFNEGASEEDFAKLEKVLGFALPDDFKEIYRIHDGADVEGVFVDTFWCSIDVVMSEYQVWHDLYEAGDFLEAGKDMGCEPDDGIKSDFWFNPKWIPLTGNGCGDGKMIDLDPSETGTAGQIIQMWHDDPSREVVALSLKELFEQFAQDLENDEYAIHSAYDGLVRMDELSAKELAELDG